MEELIEYLEKYVKEITFKTSNDLSRVVLNGEDFYYDGESIDIEKKYTFSSSSFNSSSCTIIYSFYMSENKDEDYLKIVVECSTYGIYVSGIIFNGVKLCGDDKHKFMDLTKLVDSLKDEYNKKIKDDNDNILRMKMGSLVNKLKGR